MQFDLTVTISVILALVAIIVPVIGQWISAHHDTKVKQLEFENKQFTNFDLHKREILEQAISDLSKCAVNGTVSAYEKVGVSLGKALPYLDKQTYLLAIQIINSAHEDDGVDKNTILYAIEGLCSCLQTITKPDKPEQRIWYKRLFQKRKSH